MLTDDLYNKHKNVGIRFLRFEDRQRAIDRLIEEGLSGVDAEDLTDRLMAEIKSENRSFGITAIVLGVFGVVATIGIMIISDRLFYVILAISGIAFLVGLATFMRPSPYRLRTQLSDD
jgi:hypothetical protein